MIDPELKHHLELIEKEIRDLRVDSTSFMATIWKGLVYGAGYVAGAVLVIVIIGWLLNIVGVIPAFTNQVTEFRAALDRFGAVK